MEELSLAEKSGIKNNINNYLNFIVGNDGYGMEVTQIREVIEYSQIINLTRIPMVHESILGVINLRGEVIPVIDLSMRLYNRKITIAQKTAIIIVSMADADERVTVGAIIDEVKGVVGISGTDMMAAPDIGSKIRPEFIDNIVKVDNEFTILLNTGRLLDIDELSDLVLTDIDTNQLMSLKTLKQDEMDFYSEKNGEPGKEAEEVRSFITISIGELYGIDMSYVNEMINIAKMTYMPNALPFMKGVINLRGRVIPVVDMRERCNLPKTEYTKKTPILIVKLENQLIGLIVDSVNNIVKHPVSRIQYPPHYSAKIESDFIHGLIEKDGEIIILLNVNKILSSEEQEMIGRSDLNK